MPAPATTADFLALAAKCGILCEADAPADAVAEDKPVRCAAVLVRAGKLTHFQAKNLLAGKHKGLMLGQYRLLAPLGQGGMGTVYLAEHATLHRQVALKVLPPTQAHDQLARERFLREARSAAALDHPNVVRMLDVSESGGVKYLVMEYVVGTDLGTIVESAGRIPAATAVGYMIQTARGLMHAHAKGFVHRDIKPGNLMVTADGTVKILDMGLTRKVEDASDQLTMLLGRAGDAAGSVDFASPEQSMDEPVDRRSDIYSLGATLVSLLTGKPPYDGTTAQKLMQHHMGAVPDLEKLPGVVPPGLAAVIRKLMAKKPEDRYQTADEVIAALEKFADPDREVGARRGVPKWAAAVAAGVLVGGGGLAAWLLAAR